jgi:hypothetical protein
MSTVAKSEQGGKTGMPALSPYEELCWRTLRAALRQAPRVYTYDGWFRLDRTGRRRLEEDGLDKADLERAINYGVAVGLLARRVFDAIPRVKLIEKGERR